MASFWKSKVVPKFKKLFEKSKSKKQGAEFSKTFDSSKESLDKEIEEKSVDLSPKIVEIYRSSSTYISKKLLKEPEESEVKENPEVVQTLLQELVNGGFPGSQGVFEAGSKLGPGLVSGPVFYLFKKASLYLVEEPLPSPPVEEKGEEKKVSEEEGKEKEEEAVAIVAVREEEGAVSSTIHTTRDREVVIQTSVEEEAIAITAAEKKETEHSAVSETTSITTVSTEEVVVADAIAPPKEEEEEGKKIGKKGGVGIEELEKKEGVETPPPAVTAP